MNTISQQIDDYIADNGGGSVRDVLNVCMAKAQDVADRYDAAKARIEELEDTVKGLCDVLNPYSHAIGETGQEKLRRAFSILGGLQDALHSEHMRPCDERP